MSQNVINKIFLRTSLLMKFSLTKFGEKNFLRPNRDRNTRQLLHKVEMKAVGCIFYKS